MKLFSLLVFTLISGVAIAGEPIYLQPGQCILVGSQQVCAIQTNSTTNQESSTIYTCRYGQHSDAEVPDLKSYALLQIIVKPNGAKTEISIKNYGMREQSKKDCERDAETKNSAKK